MGRRRGPLAVAALMAAAALLAAACDSGDSSGSGSGSGSGTDGSGASDGGPVVEQFAGTEMSIGVIPDTPTEATGEPIPVGLLNQEDTPLGSFPEVRLGAETAVQFLNEEMGGVDGRPIELHTCITDFSPEQSSACAQEMVQSDVVAVLGGIDLASAGSMPIFEQNEIPYVGGIPANFEEAQSPVSFQFSGGTWGAMTAFAYWAAEEVGAEKVAIAYGEFPPISDAAIQYGEAVLEARGVDDVDLVAFPIDTTDFLPVVTRAMEGNPDAIFWGTADAGCQSVMQSSFDLGVSAQLFMTGACAAPRIVEEVGPGAEGVLFNIEGVAKADVPNPEVDLFTAVADRYGEGAFDPQSAATVSFRSTMNLYALMTELGADNISTATIMEGLRTAVDVPSFDGHPYTCDGEQIPDLPAMCSPQENLVVWDGTELSQVNDDWIQVPEILREAGVG